MSQNIIYQYKKLKDLQREGDYNFYAVIYDASLPFQENTPNTYSCTIKVVDEDINGLKYPESLNNELVYIIIKSNTKDNLPYIHTFGDIIRIQKGKLKYNSTTNMRQVYLNLTSIHNIKCSWTIFPSKTIFIILYFKLLNINRLYL